MARPRFPIEKKKDGRYRLQLSSDEREVLRALPRQLLGLLGSNDPSLRRLTPPAHPDDPKMEAEYRELVGGELDSRRRRSLEVMEETIEAKDLDEEQISAWLTALNDLRLVLGTRLDVTEDLYEEGIPEDDSRAPLYAVYLYLGWLEEQVVSALAAGLPES
ncbi:MAG: DUF2017 family protein [Actinomycetota bacterium]